MAMRAALLATETMLSPVPVLGPEGGEPAPLQTWQSDFTLRPWPRACGRPPRPDHLPKAPPAPECHHAGAGVPALLDA